MCVYVYGCLFVSHLECESSTGSEHNASVQNTSKIFQIFGYISDLRIILALTRVSFIVFSSACSRTDEVALPLKIHERKTRRDYSRDSGRRRTLRSVERQLDEKERVEWDIPAGYHESGVICVDGIYYKAGAPIKYVAKRKQP